MQQIGITNLAFLGNRGYIHSTDLFNEFIVLARGLSNELRPHAVAAFKISREIDCDGTLWASVNAAPVEMDGRKPAALFVCPCDKGKVSLAFYDNGLKVERRRPDRPVLFESLSPAGAFCGSASCLPLQGPADLFKALVDINKALHVGTLRREGLSEPPFRFVYAESIPLDMPAGASPAVKVEHLGRRLASPHTFTLNRFEWQGATLKTCICFSY